MVVMQLSEIRRAMVAMIFCFFCCSIDYENEKGSTA